MGNWQSHEKYQKKEMVMDRVVKVVGCADYNLPVQVPDKEENSWIGDIFGEQGLIFSSKLRDKCSKRRGRENKRWMRMR